jgi:hypothetical protein
MTTDRTAYTAGLRALADALDNDLDLPLPYHGSRIAALSIFTEKKDEVVAYARLLPGKVDKAVTDGHYGFELRGALHGLNVLVYAPREEVCERVVRGTREITREVPDPQALTAVPTTTVTETVEDVEWVCRPLLAPEPGETSDQDRQAAVEVNKAQSAQHYSGLAEQAATL